MDFPGGPFPRIRKTVGILVLVTGIGICVGAFSFYRHLVNTSPTVSTPLTGQIVQEGKGSPHYFVTTDEDHLEDMLFDLGFVVVAFGATLCAKEPTRPVPPAKT
jgi:hypothetical protein